MTKNKQHFLSIQKSVENAIYVKFFKTDAEKEKFLF